MSIQLPPALLKKLKLAGFEKPIECLWHLPIGYEDRTRVISLQHLSVGTHAYFCGRIVQSDIVYQPRRMLKCLLEENGAFLMLRFFYFHAGQAGQLRVGARVAGFGEIRYVGTYREVAHPSYQILGADEAVPLSDQLSPIYPKVTGFGNLKFLETVQSVLTQVSEPDGFPELLRSELFRSANLSGVQSNIQEMTALNALKILHAPQKMSQELRESARRRLAFEELVAQRLGMLHAKKIAGLSHAHCFVDPAPTLLALRENLPFQLTSAQERVLAEILEDLKRPHPMHRLLQGDVGSGKTLVAFMAALQVIHGGYQVALMVPTEILAEQHAATARLYLAPLGISIVSLKSKMPTLEKRRVLSEIRGQEAPIRGSKNIFAQLVIGTHALFQEGVEFARLGLVMMDEQHRFGVKQRKALLDKGAYQNSNILEHAHQLLLSATPIPRTLAMTLYGDLDISTLDEIPPGRTPVKTALISGGNRTDVISHVQQAIQSGRQVYWVCPLIETSEILTCQAAEAIFEELKHSLLGDQIGLIHGRLEPQAKQAIMQAFSLGQVNLLVATSVIEVGVNVPNASIMIIENPERMGLAQLHQLRGRVGRGEIESFCILLYEPGLSKTARARLDILRYENNGFKIAEEDLKLRGPGQWLGTQQTGALQFFIADFSQDFGLVESAHRLAEQLFQQRAPEVPELISRWVRGGLGWSHV